MRLQSPYDFATTHPVEAVSGAAVMVRRAVLDEVGGLDEEYRHTGEDVDLFLRVRRAGWRIDYVHDSVIVHHGAASSRLAPNRTTAESIIAGYRFYRVHHSLWHAIAYRAVVVFLRVPITLGSTAVSCIRKRSSSGWRGRASLARSLLCLSPYRGRSDP
jgi:GT2 family glycosyltransferase